MGQVINYFIIFLTFGNLLIQVEEHVHFRQPAGYLVLEYGRDVV